jgi:MFS family permease
LQNRFAKLESYNGLGLLIGPSIGSVLNLGLGYAGPLFVYAGLIGILLILQVPRLPNDSKEMKFKPTVSIPYLRILRSGRILILMSVGVLMLGALQYQSPFLVNHLSSFNINQNYTALLFTIPALLSNFFNSHLRSYHAEPGAETEKDFKEGVHIIAGSTYFHDRSSCVKPVLGCC